MDYLQYPTTVIPVSAVINKVLNLIINGLPSILTKCQYIAREKYSFKPYYKWITFNTLTKGMNVVFMLERSLFYMVAKFEHFSVIHGFLTFYIKFLLQIFYFFLK